MLNRQESCDWSSFVVPAEQKLIDPDAPPKRRMSIGSSFTEDSQDMDSSKRPLLSPRFRLYTAADDEEDTHQANGSNAPSDSEDGEVRDEQHEPVHRTGSGLGGSTRRVSTDATSRSMAIMKLLQQSKALRTLPSRLQMLLTREMKEEIYSGSTPAILYNALDDEEGQGEQIMLVEGGTVDLTSPQDDGTELLVGRAGPGSILGGLHTLGMTSSCLLTVRHTVPSRHNVMDLAKPEEGGDLEEAEGEQLTVFVMSGHSIEAMRMEFEEELNVLRRHVMREFKHFVVESFCKNEMVPFLRPFTKEVVMKLLRRSDLQIVRAGDDVFVEDDPAHTMAILCAGKLQVFIREKFITNISNPGACVGESSLADGLGRRAATVRCEPDRDAIILILHKDTFTAMLEAYPEERQRLKEQVLTKLTQAGLENVFPNCSKDFLRWLALKADTMELMAGQESVTSRNRADMLLLCLRGAAVLVFKNGTRLTLRKGELYGLDEAVGLKEAGSAYTLKSEAGCSILSIAHEVLDRAMLYFPGEVQHFLGAKYDDVPAGHPLCQKEDALWELVQPMFCRSLLSMDCDQELCRAFKPALSTRIYERNVNITEQEHEPGCMIFVLDGTFTRTYAHGEFSFTLMGPYALDEDVLAGLRRRSTSTCRSLTPCLAWVLALEQANSLRRSDLRLFRLFEHSLKAWRAVEQTIQSRAKTKRAFQLFHPRVTELVSENAHVAVFTPGECIMERGLEAECLYILLQGSAELELPGKEVTVLESGSVVGESCLLGAMLREADVKATSLSVCYVVHKDLVTMCMKLHAAEQNAGARKVEARNSEAAPMGASASMGKALARPSIRKSLSRRSTWASQALPGRAARGGSSSFRRAKTASQGQAALAISFDLENISQESDSEHESSGSSSRSSSADADAEEAIDLDSAAKQAATHVKQRPQTPPRSRGRMSAMSSKRSSERLGSPNGDANASDQASAPSKLQQLAVKKAHLSSQRCMQSALAGTAMPVMPAAGNHLYRAPRTAKAKLQNAFRQVLPPVTLAAEPASGSSPSKPVIRVTAAPEQCVGKPGRRIRASPTYTDPVSPWRIPMPPKNLNKASKTVRKTDQHYNIILAGHLHQLASSLLRINSKGQLRQGQGGQQAGGKAAPQASGNPPPSPGAPVMTDADLKQFLRHNVMDSIARGDHNPTRISDGRPEASQYGLMANASAGASSATASSPRILTSRVGSGEGDGSVPPSPPPSPASGTSPHHLPTPPKEPHSGRPLVQLPVKPRHRMHHSAVQPSHMEGSHAEDRQSLSGSSAGRRSNPRSARVSFAAHVEISPVSPRNQSRSMMIEMTETPSDASSVGAESIAAESTRSAASLAESLPAWELGDDDSRGAESDEEQAAEAERSLAPTLLDD